MLKELSLLKWQEKATNLASEDNASKILKLQSDVSSLEENLKTERYTVLQNNPLLVYTSSYNSAPFDDKNFTNYQE